MRFFESAALLLTAASTAALPTDVEARAHQTQFHVTGLYGAAIQHSTGSDYEFWVEGIGKGRHAFPKTHCTGQNRQTAYTLGEVKHGKCDNPDVDFTFLQNENKKGAWVLVIGHVTDQVAYYIPKNRIGENDAGSGFYEFIKPPYNFKLNVK